MSSLLYDDNTLDRLEQLEQWDLTVKHLSSLMLANEQDKSILYRLAAQSWYVLTFWDCNMPKERLNRRFFEHSLEKSYEIAKERWWNDSNCLWLFGYFMCINQFDFPFVSTDIREVETEGNSLITEAVSIAPDNPLARILYLADNGKRREYRRVKKIVKRSISLYFNNGSAVERYFSDGFSNLCV